MESPTSSFASDFIHSIFLEGKSPWHDLSSFVIARSVSLEFDSAATADEMPPVNSIVHVRAKTTIRCLRRFLMIP